jgi:hypothetical protein
MGMRQVILKRSHETMAHRLDGYCGYRQSQCCANSCVCVYRLSKAHADDCIERHKLHRRDVGIGYMRSGNPNVRLGRDAVFSGLRRRLLQASEGCVMLLGPSRT